MARQIEREGLALGYQCRVIRDQSEAGDGINICNYDRLDKLDPAAYGAVSLDEASILKSFTGKTTRALIELFKGQRFKMVATATPAPNDHMELGNYGEFLEIMAANEMLSRFFINDTSTASQQWRLKGHAERSFWDWMASWSRMAELPSDLGDADEGYILPPLNVHRHKAADSNIAADTALADMFGVVSLSATNIFDIKRQTLSNRAKLAAEIVFGDLACGNENTLIGVEKNIRLILPSEIDGKIKSGMLTSGSDTIENIISPIKINTSKPQKRKTDTMQPEKSDMPMMQNIEIELSQKQSLLPSDTQIDRRTKSLENPLALDCKTIEPCLTDKTEHVLSAELERQDGENISASIIATLQEKSEGFSAKNAISALAVSETIQRTSNAQHIISRTLKTWVLWCDTNDEQKELEKYFGDLCVSIYGHMSADEKERLHEVWLLGERPIILCKPTMFGHGCNWQHCNNMIFVGRTFSYETYYQAVRRCWRYGQNRPVDVHIVVAEGESEIGRVIDRKADDHGKMKRAMRDAMGRANTKSMATKIEYNPKHNGRLPAWL